MDKCKILMLSLLLPAALKANAQEEREIIKANAFSDPSVYGQARGKGLSVNYERFAPYDIRSESDSAGNSNATVQRFNRLEFKLKLPVWNKPNLKIIAGFKYQKEKYNYLQPEQLTYALYRNLNQKSLKSIGGNLMVLRSFNEVNFLVLRVSGDLNGDYKDTPFSGGRYLKSTLAAIYGWKRNEAYSYGVGLQVNYNFGRQSVYPAFMYNRTFTKRWGVEGLLPANFRVRYNASDYTYMYLGYALQGTSYNLNINPTIAGYPRLEYRQTSILTQFIIERELLDFLWVGMEAGYRFNYRNRLVPERRPGREAIIDTYIKPAPYVSVGLYVVAPRKFVKKEE